ncbi:MAG: 2-C-methyl-D-erythritol 4-phosphate cytidylyltransferase [Spirochaetales bacterium]|nr:2-C-methyl-D-erythritol 4-phosphate cytidylyltransferase [Spirochaetales bacterium]
MNVAVILAAGSSTRMGQGIKKEYMTYKGKPLLHHGVETFLNTGLFDKIVLVCREDYIEATQDMLNDLKGLDFIVGGSTRQESVYLSLLYLKDYSPHYVLIHDGARPFVSPPTIEAVIKKTKAKGAAIPVEPATNTMKIVDGEGRITNHLHRASTKGAQTPQGFEYTSLLDAHEKARNSTEEFTDDSEIWDRFVTPVFTVEGNRENDKITYLSDLNALGIAVEEENR